MSKGMKHNGSSLGGGNSRNRSVDNACCDGDGRRWIIIDARGAVLGRLSAFLSHRLRGKHLAQFAPEQDDGDKIVVINAEHLRLTGSKASKKEYVKHTGYMGGLKSTPYKKIANSVRHWEVIKRSVKGMLPSGPLGRMQLKNLYVYKGPEHPHGAQKPQEVDFVSMNRKNAC